MAEEAVLKAYPDVDSSELKSVEVYVDRPLAEFMEVYGGPISASNAGSCPGPERDGELQYYDFTVYINDDGNTEIILDVHFLQN